MSGLSTSALVLSYPTCLFVVVPVSIGICCVSTFKNRWCNLMCYLFTCAFCGISWLSYFLFICPFLVLSQVYPPCSPTVLTLIHLQAN